MAYEQWIKNLLNAQKHGDVDLQKKQQLLLEGAYEYALAQKDDLGKIDEYLRDKKLLVAGQDLASFIRSKRADPDHGGIADGDLSFAQYLNDAATVGNFTIPGGKQVKLLAGGIVLTQLQVADQCATCKTCGNIGGGKDSCGYHAVKNSAYLVNVLNKADVAQADQLMLDLNDYAIVKKLFGVGAGDNWRSYVIQSRSRIPKEYGEQDLSGEFISSYEIKAVIEDAAKRGFLGDKLFNYSIVDTIGNLKASAKFFAPVQKAFTQENYRHAFILGTMGKGLEKGHWFVVVVNKRGNIFDYIIMDSKNIIRLYDSVVKELIKFVQPDKAVAIEKEFNGMQKAVSEAFAKENNLPISEKFAKENKLENLPLHTPELREKALRLVGQFKQLGGDAVEVEKLEARIAAAGVKD